MVPGVETGTLLGGTYRIVRRIGGGGMGEVYEATHERLSHRYAVKFLHPAVREHPEALPRFMREAQITSRLRHPGIVSVVDFNTLPGGQAYLVMEYLEGESLGKILARSGPLPLPRVVDITDQVSSALTAAHLQGVVHRDMHPQNIFVLPAAGGQSERIKILDFGISKIASISQRITGMAAVLGTPQYMSPEQAEGKTDELEAASDQFSLAAIVYEMLTGKQAFSGATLASVAYQIVHTRPPPIERFRPELPVEIESVVSRGLAKDKKERFPSVSEFAVHLRWTATLPARVAPPGTARDQGVPTPVESDTEETTAVSALPSGMAAVLRQSNSDLVATDGGLTTVGRPARDDEMTVVSTSPPADLPPAPAEQPAANERTSIHELTAFGIAARGRGAIIAAVGGALVVIAVIVGVASRARRPPVAERRPAAPTAPAAPAEPVAPVAAAPTPGDAQAAEEAPAIRAAADEAPDPPPAATPTAPPPPIELGGARRSSGRSRQHAGAARAPAATAEDGAKGPAATGQCKLTVGTYPWSELWIDGADTGQHTPVVGLAIPCGQHRLQFRRRDLKIDQAENVTLNEGHEFRRQYELRGAALDE